jgi:hypothetical protein
MVAGAMPMGRSLGRPERLEQWASEGSLVRSGQDSSDRHLGQPRLDARETRAAVLTEDDHPRSVRCLGIRRLEAGAARRRSTAGPLTRPARFGYSAGCRMTQCSGLTDWTPSVLPPISAAGPASRRPCSRVNGEKHEGGEQDEVHCSLQSCGPARDDGEDCDDDREGE